MNNANNNQDNLNISNEDDFTHPLADYIRVGTEYYRIVDMPLKNDTIQELVKWKKETIKDDFETKNFKPIYKIKKYTGFCFVPGHGDDYQEEINGFFNSYEKLSHRPKPGSCDQTIDFLKHIFGDQIEIGLDYLALLYLNPTQILPILCLVSEERSTGKSTFVKWLKALYQNNMTINSNEEFRARFNSDWITKLIIAVEETLLEKREDSERIKALSTGDRTKKESKNKDKFETPFYGKFILCSNNETGFINIDRAETRYWVRKIKTIEKRDPLLLDNHLIPEIPAFLHFIVKRGIKSKMKDRMWFSPDQIYTEALSKLKRDNRTGLEKEIETFILDKMDDFGLDKIKFTLGDLYDELKALRVSKDYIRKILLEKFKLSPGNSQAYKKYHWAIDPYNGEEFIVTETTARGKCYAFTRSIFEVNEYDYSKILKISENEESQKCNFQ